MFRITTYAFYAFWKTKKLQLMYKKMTLFWSWGGGAIALIAYPLYPPLNWYILIVNCYHRILKHKKLPKHKKIQPAQKNYQLSSVIKVISWEAQWWNFARRQLGDVFGRNPQRVAMVLSYDHLNYAKYVCLSDMIALETRISQLQHRKLQQQTICARLGVYLLEQSYPTGRIFSFLGSLWCFNNLW